MATFPSQNTRNLYIGIHFEEWFVTVGRWQNPEWYEDFEAITGQLLDSALADDIALYFYCANSQAEDCNDAGLQPPCDSDGSPRMCGRTDSWAPFATSTNCAGDGIHTSDLNSADLTSLDQCLEFCAEYNYAGWWWIQQRCRCWNSCDNPGTTSVQWPNIVYTQDDTAATIEVANCGVIPEGTLRHCF